MLAKNGLWDFRTYLNMQTAMLNNPLLGVVGSKSTSDCYTPCQHMLPYLVHHLANSALFYSDTPEKEELAEANISEHVERTRFSTFKQEGRNV